MTLCFSSNLLVRIYYSCSYLYLLTIGNIRISGIITSSKHTIKYLELFFVSVNYDITILSTSPSQTFIYIYIYTYIYMNIYIYNIFIYIYIIYVYIYNFFRRLISSFCTFVLPNLNIIKLSKNHQRITIKLNKIQINNSRSNHICFII